MATARKKPVMKVVIAEQVEEWHGYATKDSAGIDIKSGITTTLRPLETKIINTGIKVAIPKGHVGILASRSGLGVKEGLVVAQGVGVIDSDYRGELKVPIFNRNERERKNVLFGDRIAQLLIMPVIQPAIEVVTVANVYEDNSLDETERGEGGFGSTGKAGAPEEK